LLGVVESEAKKLPHEGEPRPIARVLLTLVSLGSGFIDGSEKHLGGRGAALGVRTPVVGVTGR
jgi:hypothetical protein